MDEESISFRSFLPAVAVGAASFAFLAFLTLRPPETGAAAVQFPPDYGLAEASAVAARVDGVVVGDGGLPGMFVIWTPPGVSPSALYGHGAWVVADPVVVGGCVVASGSSRSAWVTGD